MARIEIDPIVIRKFYFIFLPFATLTKVGEIVLLTILGIPVYTRVDDTKSILGFVIKPKENEILP